MTRDEAKKILALHRPGVMEEADPRMAEALEFVQRDPELAEWFEQQGAVFRAIRAKLKAIPVPEDLRQQIIAGQQKNTRVVPLARWLAIAAAAAVVLLTAIIWPRFTPNPENTFDGYRNRMASMMQRGYSMKMTGTNQADIRNYFASKGASSNFELPRSLEKLPGEGGVVFTWNSHPVSLLCLDASNAPGQKNDLYLFMASRSVIPGAPAPGKKPEFKKVSAFMTMAWVVGDRVYLLTGNGGEDEAALQKYLE